MTRTSDGDREIVVDEDGDSLEFKRPTGGDGPFPILVSATDAASGDICQVYLTEESLRDLLSWLSDTIST